MTIKELEERTGMHRANIRFYEDEGLLKPRRLPNGYRDYSEADIVTLEKIKLLRQIHLDISTIRLVQEGKLSLERAMFSQLNRLEGDKAAVERAAEVCRGIERSGVEYAALEPKPWLKELEEPRKKELGAPEPPQEPTELEKHYWTHRACDHPWMRFFARGIDYGICKLLFYAVFLLVFRWYGYLDLGWFANAMINIVIYCASILVEPLWLHYVGWTPGKWIFGLKLRDKNGEKLSLGKAWSRSWRVAWEGDGLYIPFYVLWRNWKSYKCCSNGEDCGWDVYESCMYTCEGRSLYGLWWAAEHLVSLGLTALIIFAAFMPPALGGLTVKEFCRNYNDRLSLYETDSYNGLSHQGVWEAGTAPSEWDYTYTIYIDGEPETTEVTGETVWLDPEFVVEDGLVTSVTFTMKSSRTIVRADYGRELFGFLAFSGALDGLSVFSYDADAWVESWYEILEQTENWENFDYVYRGIRITQTVETDGYVPDGTGLLIADDTARPACTRTITFSLTGSEP